MGQKAHWEVVKERKTGTVISDDNKVTEIEDNVPENFSEEIAAESVTRHTPLRDKVSREQRLTKENYSSQIVPENESVQRVRFPEVKQSLGIERKLEKIDYLRDVELAVSVELGNTVLSVEEILGLDSGSVVELNQTVGEEVKILINGNAYAMGEVVVVGEKFGVRISRILNE